VNGLPELAAVERLDRRLSMSEIDSDLASKNATELSGKRYKKSADDTNCKSHDACNEHPVHRTTGHARSNCSDARGRGLRDVLRDGREGAGNAVRRSVFRYGIGIRLSRGVLRNSDSDAKRISGEQSVKVASSS